MIGDMEGRRRVAALIVLLAAPLAGLLILLLQPDYDVTWEHHPAHFWLVLSTASICVTLGLAIGVVADRRGDPRLALVSLAMLASAGFLGLHALATPGVLLSGPNAGFVVATPIGLLLASGFAVASASNITENRRGDVLRWTRAGRIMLVVAIVAWAVASLTLFPVGDPAMPTFEIPAGFRVFALAGVIAFVVATARYVGLYQARHSVLPIAVATAWILLAEALIAVTVGRSWHASWWEWHVLMTVAFGELAIVVRVQYRREGSLTAALTGLYLDATLRRLDARDAVALGQILEAFERGQPVEPVLDQLHREQGLTRDETDVLRGSALELRRVDGLFRPYIAPQLAETIAREPELARLGGREQEVSVLFADLENYTTFCARRPAAQTIEMLNAYWAAIVPAVLEREAGMIERFAGDAVMVVFNAFGDQSDHAMNAARAALALRDAAETVVGARPDWPRFRVGVNSGAAVVGNVGAGQQRSFAAIGDTVNVAARLQTSAHAGHVLVSSATERLLVGRAELVPAGALTLRGKGEPVEAWELIDVRGEVDGPPRWTAGG
jgi:adenylate cyclase